MPRTGQLMSAAVHGNVEEVRTLLKAGADIEERDKVSDGAGTSVAAGFVGVVRGDSMCLFNSRNT